MAHSVTLLFNVEDIVTPASDTALQAMLQALDERNLPGTFFVSGDKARQLKSEQKTELIAALRNHEIGLHSNRHARHPTLSEYLAPLSWDDGLYAVWTDEERGADALSDIFGKPPRVWGQAGGAWGPQVNPALAKLGFEGVVYPRTQPKNTPDVHWYANQLSFPQAACCFFDTDLMDETAFEEALENLYTTLDERILAGYRWTGVFVGRPSTLKTEIPASELNFAAGQNPAPNNYQTPPLRPERDYQTGLNNLGRLLKIIQRDTRLSFDSISTVSRHLPAPPDTVYLRDVDLSTASALPFDDIPTNFYVFSAAEHLDVLARLYSLTTDLETIHRRNVLGPTDPPPAFDPGPEYVYWDDFVAACRHLSEYVTDHSRLPSNVYMGKARWNMGAVYQAAVEAWPAYREGRPPRYVAWQPAPLYPAVGHQIAAAVQEAYETWPIHPPELDLNNLLMHTSFQSWTLRLAYPTRPLEYS